MELLGPVNSDLDVARQLDTAKTTIAHAGDASMARPAVSEPVLWVGTVQPQNWLDGDMWVNPEGSSGVVATSSAVVVANGGAAITDPNFVRPSAPLVIWPMADGVTPNNAVWPDIVRTADA